MNWQILRKVCLANAEEPVNAAKILNVKNTAHIRYHLAVMTISCYFPKGITTVFIKKIHHHDGIKKLPTQRP